MFRRITLVSWSRRGGQASLLKSGAIIGGLLWALTSTVFICAALVLWAIMTAGQVYHFGALLTAGTMLGALLGGVVSGRIAGNMGWLHGIVVGFLYGLVMLSFLAAWNGTFAALPGLAGRGLTLVLMGVLGGVAGVNMSAYDRRRDNFRPGLR
ncbi:MAG: TIGR04086 family membrane protein [Desulfotomaculaceae bacterium]